METYFTQDHKLNRKENIVTSRVLYGVCTAHASPIVSCYGCLFLRGKQPQSTGLFGRPNSDLGAETADSFFKVAKYIGIRGKRLQIIALHLCSFVLSIVEVKRFFSPITTLLVSFEGTSLSSSPSLRYVTRLCSAHKNLLSMAVRKKIRYQYLCGRNRGTLSVELLMFFFFHLHIHTRYNGSFSPPHSY